MSVQIKINDHPLLVEKGLSILHAARQNGFEIPTLCDFPGLPPHGSCRICIVEIQGRQVMPASCSTPVEEGMVIYTHSPRVQALRKELLQMLLAEHPSACLFCPERNNCDECMVTVRKAAVTTGCGSCPKDSQCELQALAGQYGIDQPGFPIRYRMLPVEKMDPFFDRDYNLCILCSRCIRVCADLHFANALTYTKRGAHAIVGTAFHQSHLETSCSFCGACVEVCPTGALSEKTRKWDGKPERQTPSTCPLCSMGCQINLLSKKERIIGSLPNRTAGVEALCVKGRFGITELVNHPTRLKQPQKRDGSTWLGFGWEEAVQAAAKKLSACPPDRFAMRISASCTNEDLFVAAKFAREVMKSENISNSAQDHYGPAIEAVARLLQQSQQQEPSGPLEALRDASTVLCLGLEDRYAQSTVEVRLHRAKEHGAQIIALGVNKLPWSGHASEWLQAEPGQEAALVQKISELAAVETTSAQDNSALARAARLLRRPGQPVVILGPAALVNPALLQSTEALVQNLCARVIVLPEQGNLAGALRMGLLSGSPMPAGQELDLLYLVGEAVPDGLTSNPFILYQNLYPPAGDSLADLMLPAAAFTETEGTFFDSTGRVRVMNQAVPPPGEALPNWLILSRIAQALGAPGFDYASVKDIQAEIFISGWALPSIFHRAALDPAVCQPQLDPPGDYMYMGYPLAQFVVGLRSLNFEEEWDTNYRDEHG